MVIASQFKTASDETSCRFNYWLNSFDIFSFLLEGKAEPRNSENWWVY